MTAQQTEALALLAAALEACHKLQINVIARQQQVSLLIEGRHRVLTHTLDHKAVRDAFGIR
jgi:organic hydroperoxide reductase OsmC/OhrA